MSRSATSIPVRSLADPIDEGVSKRLSELLPEYVAAQRWFRAKTRTIERVDIDDVFSLPQVSAHILILTLHYQDGESDHYILPVSLEQAGSAEQKAPVAHLVSEEGKDGVLYSSLEDSAFRSALLRAIACEENISGRNGTISAKRTSALSEGCDPQSLPQVDSFVSRAEQSNTSVIYRDRYILKLFRKLESGVNPDLEIGAFLTAHAFRNTPAVLGSVTYQPGGEEGSSAVAILQQFVPNQGDAWKYTLDELGGFFEKALASKKQPPERKSEHPLDLLGEPIPSEVRTFIGPYLESAALLGKRTAEMHAALASNTTQPDFLPEPFSAADGRQLYRDLINQSLTAFDLMRRKLSALSGPVAEDARRMLGFEDAVKARFAGLETQQIAGLRIRHHGDYHLGQVLYTGQDFMIIDFEGEPARPLEERRAKALALRDVAGMVRSFQYAAYAALFGQVAGVPSDPAAQEMVASWAAAWNAYVSATYLRAYFDEVANRPFVSSSWSERRLLLDAFLLQKALYELAYELNNRPDWLPIPLRGILSLMS